MIIGFDASRAFLKYKTGTENYSYQVLKALSQIDSKNTYVLYIRSSTLPGDALRGWPKNFQFRIINFPRFWTQIGLAVQTFKDNLNLLFVPAHTVPLIRKLGLKTVVTVHDLGSEYLPQTHQIKQRLYLSFMQKYQLKGATRIVAVSGATKDDLVKKIKLNPDNIKVIHEGYNKDLYKPIKGEILTSGLIHFDLRMGEYFLFVGTVQPRKNLERLIKAFAHYSSSERSESRSFRLRSNSNLVIAGSKGWLSDDIYELPKKLGIEDRVKFLGYVPDENLPVLYSGTIALLLPSLFEGFGLPILEAQACGCPVITSNISSMPEVAGKGAIYVNPYSIDDIVEGMERLQGTGYRLQLIKKGFENVKRFSWKKCAAQTLEVIEEAARI